jgi:hypothetical protein
VGSIDRSVGAFRTPDSLFLDDRVASGWTVRLTLIVAVVPFALGVLDLLVRTRRRRLPLVPALRALRARLAFWAYCGLLLWVGALTGLFPTGTSLSLPAYSPFILDWPIAGLAVLAIALGLGWFAGRRRLVPVEAPRVEERLAGYAVALTWLGLVAFLIAVTRPYALVFVLPSLYAWLWLPLRTRIWERGAIYVLGLTGPVVGLLVLANELDLDVVDAPLYAAGLATVGYVSLGSVLLALFWGAAAAQLAALAFGRYGPYAGGMEPPPPGPIRSSVARLAGLRRPRASNVVITRREADAGRREARTQGVPISIRYGRDLAAHCVRSSLSQHQIANGLAPGELAGTPGHVHQRIRRRGADDHV